MDGEVVTTSGYFLFGYCRFSQGTLSTDKKFTGQRLDSTGLYYYNARYYDPNIGRFISADATGQDLYNPQTLNRYSYCSNNPLKYIDPSGHSFGSFINSCVNFAAAHPVIAALAVVLVVSAAIIAAPVVLGAISTAACVAGATSVAVAAEVTAAAIVPTATAIASIPVYGALATTVANVGLGLVGLGCATPSGNGMDPYGEASNITQDGLDIVTKHLNQYPAVENDVMVNRLGNALNNGQNLTGADLNFYNHEITEAGMMNQGVCYNVAHIGSIIINNVSPYSLYDPEAIQASIDAANGLNEWSDGWFDYWGLSK